MSKNKEVKDVVSVGGLWPEFLIRQNEYYTNRLRGKLFNLVDAAFNDPIQRESFKGLIKDFTSDCHYALNRDIICFLEEKGIMHKGVPSESLLDHPGLPSSN